MISIQGQLAIKTLSGRFGDFNVGKLTTDIGEFVIKDAELDQYNEGKYDGEFLINKISPSYYSANNRMIIEIRATLESMTLSSTNELTKAELDKMSTQDVDPVEEANDANKVANKPLQEQQATDNKLLAADSAKSEPKPSKVQAVQTADEILFGHLWPLGEVVELDKTVERVMLRQQRDRLNVLGYSFDPLNQQWHLSAR